MISSHKTYSLEANYMHPLISVIVPVYGTEKYLSKCVESIISQICSNIEIILVDDGSIDSCPQMCDDFALKDNRIIVIHKGNGGLSNARNAGVEVASGEFVGFVDSDDWIHPQMYEILYNAINSENADLAVCDYEHVDERGFTLNLKRNTVDNGVLSRNEGLHMLISRKRTLFTPAWNKLYRKRLFNEIAFPSGKIYEDVFIVHRIFNESKKIVTLSSRLYYHRHRYGSITRSPYLLNRLDAFYAYEDKRDFFMSLGLKRHARLTLRDMESILSHGYLCTSDSKIRKELNKLTKEVFPHLIKAGYLLRLGRLLLIRYLKIMNHEHYG